LRHLGAPSPLGVEARHVEALGALGIERAAFFIAVPRRGRRDTRRELPQ
jgi:hypothetical protein